MDLYLAVVITLLGSVVLSVLNAHWGLLQVSILNRWIRWIGLSFLLAIVASEQGWSERPLWALVLAAMIGWSLLETIYNWILICALSRSTLPLFPRFEANEQGDEWPVTRESILLRDWLRARGFQRIAALKAPLAENLYLRCSVYQDEAGEVRCQVLFIPQARGGLQTSFILTTRATSGELLITDNTFMPSAAYQPDTWFLERKPLKRSLPNLLKHHQQRLREFAVEVEPWTDEEAGQELNQRQRDLEYLNVRKGFLQPYDAQDEHGRITFDGRYRLWKELWLLNYLGMTIDT